MGDQLKDSQYFVTSVHESEESKTFVKNIDARTCHLHVILSQGFHCFFREIFFRNSLWRRFSSVSYRCPHITAFLEGANTTRNKLCFFWITGDLWLIADHWQLLFVPLFLIYDSHLLQIVSCHLKEFCFSFCIFGCTRNICVETLSNCDLCLRAFRCWKY